MNRFFYIHDVLYFDDKPVSELNATERGELKDYVNNYREPEPDEDVIDRDDVGDIAYKLHKLADELESL